MNALTQMSDAELRRLHDRAWAEYNAFQARGLSLDMTRGKPGPEQLDLANGMLTLPGNRDWHTDAGEDARNYGGLQGLPEARALFAALLGVRPEQVVIGDNSSLAMMHDALAWAMLKGVPGSPHPWSRDDAPAFLCPVPGYDRHFAILSALGIRAIPVPLVGNGPDMDAVEELVRDPAVKGMWSIPRYSNPTGEIYADEAIRRLAAMQTGAFDFRLYWDDAYAVHHLTERRHGIANILDLCAEAGHPDRAFVFASTSKMTLAGAGLAVFASSPANVSWYLERATTRTIGPDKLNQLRHVRFLRDLSGIHRHMDAHRVILAPRFEAVHEALTVRLASLGIARWTKPEGGYFVAVDGPDGTARRVVALAKEAGLALTPAGSTWPGGHDPHDRTLRIAPTFPTLAEVRAASEGIALCILLAATERELDARAG